jgi:hypothetical protein
MNIRNESGKARGGGIKMRQSLELRAEARRL